MRPLPVLTLLLTLAFLAASILTPFDGYDGAQLPIPQEEAPILPAGWAFSIWGVIFSWLVVSAAYGAWRRAFDAEWDRVRVPLAVSLALGTAWPAIAERSAVWASVVIALMAAAAIAAFLAAPGRDRAILRGPVGLYAGWLTAATFVSAGSALAGFGVVLGSLGWAFVCLALALGTAVAVQVRRPAGFTYGLAVAWALIGVAGRNGFDLPGVTLLALAGAASLVAVMVLARPASP